LTEKLFGKTFSPHFARPSLGEPGVGYTTLSKRDHILNAPHK